MYSKNSDGLRHGLWGTCVALAVLCCVGAERPFELVASGRTTDAHPATCALARADEWRVEVSNAVASVATDGDHPLFADTCVKLTYRAAGRSPAVSLRPATPVELAPFDTFTLWVYGNNTPIYGQRNPTPPTDIVAEFRTPDGEAWQASVGSVQHFEWHMFFVHLPPDLRARAAKGGTFLGFTVTGGKNTTDRELFFSSFATFTEQLPPYTWKPRAKRGVVVFPHAPQGFNTGAGRLPFPTVPTTVVPIVKEDDDIEFRLPSDPTRWDDLAVRYRKGPWIPLAQGGGIFPAKNAHVRFHRIANSLVADLEAEAGVEEVRFGAAAFPEGAQRVIVPYLTYKSIEPEARPAIIASRTAGATLFFAATWDWTQSGCSEPFCEVPPLGVQASNGGVRYIPKTDGRRNPCRERFVWSVGTRCEDVFPAIPHPPSPYRAIMAERVWRGTAIRDRARDMRYWQSIWNQGASNLGVTGNQTMWRDDFESYSFRTNTAPRKGGDEGQRTFNRFLMKDLGIMHGAYLGWTDLTTMNAWWDPAQIMRLADGSLKPSWRRCYSPKVLYAIQGCEETVPVIQRKYGFDCAYCDVHTQQRPWERTDYDARCPGAGECAATYYGYGELMLRLRELTGGPVYSEGAIHWLYAGLVDGNYAQDKFYRFDINPWIVDFDLLRLHPLECDFGMGHHIMFYWRSGIEPDSPEGVDRFLTATVAFGHTGYLLTFNNEAVKRSYGLVQPLAAYYAKAQAKTIRYVDGNGALWTLSDALFNGAVRRCQIVTRYDDGTVTVANGSRTERLRLKLDGRSFDLPPNSFWGRRGDGMVEIDSSKTQYRPPVKTKK